MDIEEIMKQAQAIQKKMESVQADLSKRVIVGSAGGGLVKVTINGKAETKKVDIDTELLKPEEKDVLQDLIVAAYQDAKTKMEAEFNSSLGDMAGQFNLPPGFKFPS